MELTAYAATWFLVAALPISIYVAFSDLSQMRIPNTAVYAMLGAFAVLGLIALPFQDYIWQWSHVPIVLVTCMVLNAIGAMGAGDAKFIAAASPMIGLGDIDLIVTSLAASVLIGVASHRLAKRSPIRAATPGWASWDQENKRFPMGFPLGLALVGTS